MTPASDLNDFVAKHDLRFSINGHHFIQLDIGIFTHVCRTEYSIKSHRNATSKVAFALESGMSCTGDGFKSNEFDSKQIGRLN